GDVWVARVEDEGDAHRLKSAAGELGSMRGGGGRELRSVHVGEVHARLLEDATFLHHPRAPAAAFLARPRVFAERRPAVLGLECGADAILQVEEVRADALDVGAIRTRPG